MAAVTTAVLAPLRAGDHVVAGKHCSDRAVYVVEDLLPRYGIASTLVDGLRSRAVKRAMRPNTRSLFLESPTNPTLDVLDIGAIAEIAHQGGARLIVDNVFATRFGRARLSSAPTSWCIPRPSTSTVRAAAWVGIILSSEAFIAEHVHTFMRSDRAVDVAVQRLGLAQGAGDAGGPGPRPADTQRRCGSAGAASENLRLIYPGRPTIAGGARQETMRAGSTLVGFEVKGGQGGAFRHAQRAEACAISNNLGDARASSPSGHHYASTADAAGARRAWHHEGFVRFSAGLEHPRSDRGFARGAGKGVSVPGWRAARTH